LLLPPRMLGTAAIFFKRFTTAVGSVFHLDPDGLANT